MFFDEKFLLLKTHNKHMQNKQTKKFIAHVLFFFFLGGGVAPPSLQDLNPPFKDWVHALDSKNVKS